MPLKEYPKDINMVNQEFENKDLKIIYQRTPYDDEFVGGALVEIAEIIRKTDRTLDISDAKTLFTSLSLKFGFIRFDPQDLEKRKLLHELHFYYCSTIVDLYLLNIHQRTFPRAPSLFPMDFSRGHHINEVKEIIRHNFKHGKFYEDPYLLPVAQGRHMVILDKLFADPDTKCFIASTDKLSIAAYVIYKIKGSECEMSFAGINKTGSYPGLGMDFWNLFHDYLKGTGIKRNKVRITLTNLGVLNIYALLGYSFFDAQEEYHFLT